MLNLVSRLWKLLALRGILGLLFAAAAFLMPQATFASLIMLFGIYATADGLCAIALGVRDYGEGQRWWTLALEGLLGVVVGFLTLARPQVTALALLTIIAVWALFTGVLEILAAIRLRRHYPGEWKLLLAGACSMLFGLPLILSPGLGVVALMWLMGSYAFIFGFSQLTLALTLRKLVA
jgi:uncharacterized membrane protein HdeD (DUF308 family)